MNKTDKDRQGKRDKEGLRQKTLSKNKGQMTKKRDREEKEIHVK